MCVYVCLGSIGRHRRKERGGRIGGRGINWEDAGETRKVIPESGNSRKPKRKRVQMGKGRAAWKNLSPFP